VTIKIWRDKRGKARVKVETVWGHTQWCIWYKVKMCGGTKYDLHFWESLGLPHEVPRGTPRADLRTIRRNVAAMYMLEHGSEYVLWGTV
jgi:hypothetical protein